jgi:hypothetical protein
MNGTDPIRGPSAAPATSPRIWLRGHSPIADVMVGRNRLIDEFTRTGSACFAEIRHHTQERLIRPIENVECYTDDEESRAS